MEYSQSGKVDKHKTSPSYAQLSVLCSLETDLQWEFKGNLILWSLKLVISFEQSSLYGGRLLFSSP